MHLLYIACAIVFIVWWNSIPNELFNDPTSTVIESNTGKLLGAHIANDEQWRFPNITEITTKYQECVLSFEDKYFFYHFGVNPFSIIRALFQNITNKQVISGGSTITMQVIRLSRKGKSRTIWQKIIEILLAIRVEFSYSKSDILKLYASNAPFGGNIVGIDAASWRYFGRNPKDLSWAENAMLAVLPNAPSLIYPGKRNNLLLEKRNSLLSKLFLKGVIDKTTLELSKLEPIPQTIYSIPQVAPHLLTRIIKEHPGKRIRTTIDIGLQNQANNIVKQHLTNLQANGIHNVAMLLMNIEEGEVLAYVGNSPNITTKEHGEQVDIICSPRSSGSILKPFLYALTQDAGQILPETLIPDIPTQFGGFSPQNFNLDYEGAVPASSALSKSLNIPSVRMLRNFGIEKFYLKLKQLNFSTLTKTADHYGLSLILGGAEINMWNLAGAYASMGRMLIHYEKYGGKIFESDFRNPSYTIQEYSMEQANKTPISVGAAWLTFQALLKVNRPNEEDGWETFSSSKKIAWKTGTSFGFRDAWAVGLNRNYLVAVWCGNADGEGRPGLTGTTAAAPIMFDIFSFLPDNKWFNQPMYDMEEIEVCHLSGHKASKYCEQTDSIWVMPAGLRTEICKYHKLVHLDSTQTWQVNSKCYPIDKMIHRSWFELPPMIAWYYQRKNPFYKPKPPFMENCASDILSNVMETIYPRENNNIFVPIQLNGIKGEVVLEAVHSIPSAIIFWHIDNKLIGKTQQNHKMPISPEAGKHLLTLIDDKGNTFYKTFTVVDK